MSCLNFQLQGTLENVKVVSVKPRILDKVARTDFPLIEAVKTGDLEEVQLQLKKGTDIWEKDYEGAVALHSAAYLENPTLALEISQALTNATVGPENRKSYVNVEDNCKRTPLWWAAAKGNSDVAIHLLNSGSDALKADYSGETALHASIRMEFKPNNHEKAFECAKAIIEAAKNVGHANVLINSVTNCPINPNPRTALHMSVIIGNEDLVKYLLENDADLFLSDKYQHAALHLAIQNANPEKSVRLMDTILNAATALERKYGLTEKQDIRAQIQIALLLAGRQGNAEALTRLLEAGADASQQDVNQNTALHLAASLGSTKKAASCVERLLDEKKNGFCPKQQNEFVNLVNKESQTALYLAAKNFNTDAARKLLLAGSKYHIKTSSNETPLQKVYKCVPVALLVMLDEAVKNSGYCILEGVISDHAQLDFGPILGQTDQMEKQSNPSQELQLETTELAKINHADLENRLPFLDHIFVKIFIYKKWNQVRWWFRMSRFLHMLWYTFCIFYLMKTYREQCPFKSLNNLPTVRFSISSIGPPDAKNDSSNLELNKCNFEGFPIIGGIVLIFVSIFILICEIFPANQRFHWYYKPLKVLPRVTISGKKTKWINDLQGVILENTEIIILLIINVLPIPQILIVLLAIITSAPLFGIFMVNDSTHFSFVGGFAFMACTCIYQEVGKIPKCRVYINMLWKISKSVCLAILVYLPILLGFATAFIFLFQGMPSFSSLPQAMVKVLTLSIGELDYQNAVYDEGPFLYSGVTIMAFGGFVIFIAVILLNFMAGLATDGIMETRERRDVWMLCSKIEQIMFLESFLNTCPCIGNFGRHLVKNYLMLMPPDPNGEKRRRTFKVYIPSLPKSMQKELHALELKMIEQ